MSKRIARKMSFADALQWLADNDDISDGATATCCFVADMFGKKQGDVARMALAIYNAQHKHGRSALYRRDGGACS
jgi:hypothetical protein